MGETSDTSHSSDSIRPFPPGTRVLHVGPHKTGTTAVQGALNAARARLGAHGVWLPSPARNPVDEVKEAVDPRPPDPRRAAWRDLVAAIDDTGERIGVVSSEFFADADDAAARRIAADLGPDAHVLVTLRPLTRILPSQWQQHVQSGMSTRYEDWLTGLLDEDGTDQAAAVFWRRHRHDRFVDRWADAVGPARLTVLVVDDRERDRLLRDVEALLRLPEQFLTPARNAGNRSLTAAEIEAVRLCAEACERREWPKSVFRKYVRYGVVPRIKTGRTPTADEARITTPAWAVERAAAIGAGIADRIGAAGVRVIGDLDLLRCEDHRTEPAGTARLDPAVTAQAVLGCMAVAVRDREAAEAATAEAERLRSASLLQLVTQRARGRLPRPRGRA